MSSHKIFAVLHRWIPTSTNWHTVMVEKANYTKKWKIGIYNDYANSSSDLEVINEQVSFTKQLETTD